MILADNETKVDLLNNEAIATTIVDLLCDRPDRPVTIGVHGDWGAGKSSVLEMIEASLESRDRSLCIKFNGWRFQGFEDAKIALLEGIVTELLEKRPALTKASASVKNVFRRIDWLKIAKRTGSLAFTAFTGLPGPDQVEAMGKAIAGLAADPSQLATKANAEAALTGIGDMLKPGESKNVPEEVEEFREAFRELLRDADVDHLVVLIDDLDRCLPDTAIETLEAVRLFVFTERTAFVVAADEAMIEYAVRKHFPDLPNSTGPQTYARNYLEKLIQVPFRIPALGETETRIYVTLLMVGAELGEDDPAFNRLIAVAREKLKRPWTGGALDLPTVNAALGDAAPRARNALTLSDQIGPILASGASGNPRQIKRFLNTLVLRERTAHARGFGDDVKIPVLAKLMLAERFLPALFGQIAAAAARAPDGICTDLAALEASLGAGVEQGHEPEVGDGEKPTRQRPKPAESAQLSEWRSSSVVLDWARVEPRIGEVDLRPYLFVTKDRKDYFGASSALGHISAVAEQLLGGRFAVQALDADLRRIAGPEAAQIFELVRAKIVAGDDFAMAPAGIDGLAVLVRAQPDLQMTLIEMLESLPADRLGPWATKGWDALLSSPPAIDRFGRLLGAWARDGSPMLKLAAAAVAKTGKAKA